ncbi:MAG: hypothetical protein KAS39_06645 [Actinomycetia bacterium]|nr:hypothetical protein [Actinomycetes bacterium]
MILKRVILLVFIIFLIFSLSAEKNSDNAEQSGQVENVNAENNDNEIETTKQNDNVKEEKKAKKTKRNKKKKNTGQSVNFDSEKKVKVVHKPGLRVSLITPFNGKGLHNKLNIGLGGRILDKIFPFKFPLFFEISAGYYFAGSPGTARMHMIPVMGIVGYELYTFGPVTLVARLGFGGYGLILQPENVVSIDPAINTGMEFLFAKQESINISMVFDVDYLIERVYAAKYPINQDAWILTMSITIMYSFFN